MASLGSLLSAALALGACAEDGTSLHVICSIVPTVAQGAQSSCTYDPVGGLCAVDGEMNLAAADHYSTVLRVQSGLKPRVSQVPPRPEPNRIALRGGTVELRKTSGAPIKFKGLANPFPFLGSGTVDPGAEGAMPANLVPAAYADQLRANVQSKSALDEVVIAVKISGETDGNVKVESSEWSWPVRLTYKSPEENDGLCSMVATSACVAGVDADANTCLCKQGCKLY